MSSEQPGTCDSEVETVFWRDVISQKLDQRNQSRSVNVYGMTCILACVAGVNWEGEGEQERGRKMGDWGLGMKERLLQRPPFFHFCGRQRPQNSDWLIFDSKSHGNDVI